MKVLVVLGKRLNDDGSFHRAMTRRCDKAIEIVLSEGMDKVILSGGSPNTKAGISEAEAMRDYLVNKGIDSQLIIIENNSNTTAQNAQFSAPIIKGLRVDKIYLLSSFIHMKRFYLNPVRLFKKRLEGIEIIPLYA